MKVFAFILCLFYWPVFAAVDKPNLKLDPALKKSYLTLLKQATDFHSAIAQEDKNAVNREIQETQEIIARLYSQISNIPHFHQRIHSYKILKSIEEQLNVMNSSNPLDKTGKKKNVKKLFNSFFELAQVYDLKRDMKDKMFYCSKDKSLWFQENKKANNPVNASLKNCGRIIL